MYMGCTSAAVVRIDPCRLDALLTFSPLSTAINFSRLGCLITLPRMRKPIDACDWAMRCHAVALWTGRLRFV